MDAGRGWGRTAAALLVTAWCLAFGPVLGVAAQDASPVSPATGHAEVVAQGLAEFPQEQVVWRVAFHSAEPGQVVEAQAAASGWALADGGYLLTGGSGHPAALAPGEAAFFSPGNDIQRLAAGTEPATWYTIELATAPGDGPGEGRDGTPVFLSAPFAAPTGTRDLDLVRDEHQLDPVHRVGRELEDHHEQPGHLRAGSCVEDEGARAQPTSRL